MLGFSAPPMLTRSTPSISSRRVVLCLFWRFAPLPEFTSGPLSITNFNLHSFAPPWSALPPPRAQTAQSRGSHAPRAYLPPAIVPTPLHCKPAKELIQGASNPP